MSKTKYQIQLQAANEFHKGNINLISKNLKDAAKNFKEAIEKYKESLQEKAGTNDPQNLDDNIKKNLVSAYKNYGHTKIELAKSLRGDLKTNFKDIVFHLVDAIQIMKEDNNYAKDLERNLVIAQKNLAIYSYNSAEYLQAINAFVELKTYKSVKAEDIDPIILNAYCLQAKSEKDPQSTLEKAFSFIQKVNNPKVFNKISDADYVLEHLAKIMLIKKEDITNVTKYYDAFHTNDKKSLTEALYNDAVFRYIKGKKDANKLLLKEAVSFFDGHNQLVKDHKEEINNFLKELVEDYGTEGAKKDFDNYVLKDHIFDINDFDFA